jgi:hypothetical protein
MNKKVFLLLFISLACFLEASTTLSPMAKLMRQMLAFIDLEKQNIEKGNAAQAFPKSFEKISTAKLTAGKKPSTDHAEFIQNFQRGLTVYYGNVNTPQRKQNFNLLVSSCITCHERECPGPIQRIQKNLLH